MKNAIIKVWTGTKSCPLDSKSHYVNISYKKGLTPKHAEYGYSKCKYEGIISSEQVY